MADPTRRTPAEDGGYRHVLRLVVPMVLSNAAFTVMQFTDRVLVARFSSEAIQAAMPAGILTFCLMSLFTATAGYAGTFVAQYHGAGDRRATIRSCVAGVWLTVLFLPFFALRPDPSPAASPAPEPISATAPEPPHPEDFRDLSENAARSSNPPRPDL